MKGTATISLDDYERLKNDSTKLHSLERQIFNMYEVDITDYKKHMKEWEDSPESIGDTDEEIDQSLATASKEAVEKIVLKVRKDLLKRLLKESQRCEETEESYLLGEMEAEEFKQVKIELVEKNKFKEDKQDD